MVSGHQAIVMSTHTRYSAAQDVCNHQRGAREQGGCGARVFQSSSVPKNGQICSAGVESGRARLVHRMYAFTSKSNF